MFGQGRRAGAGAGAGAGVVGGGVGQMTNARLHVDDQSSSSSQLRRRTNAPPATPVAGFGGAVQQIHGQKVRNDTMYRQSLQVEKSIAQMGKRIL